MRDPRPRFQAWLNQQRVIDDALISGSIFFLIGWPLFAVMGLSTWLPGDALIFALVYALPMGCFVAYRRRRRSSNRG